MPNGGMLKGEVMKTTTGLILAVCLSAGGAAVAQTKPAPPTPASAPKTDTAPSASDYADALMNMDCDSCEGEVKNLRGFSLATPSASSAKPAAPAARTSSASATISTPRAAPARATPARTAPTRSAPGRMELASAPAPKPRVSASDLLITFQRGSAELTEQGAANARSFAGALNDPRVAGLSFLIVGHTDATGSADRNLELSKARAQAVKDYLVKQGVDGNRLQTEGYGSRQLAEPGAPGAEANRRVEVKRIG